MCVLRLYIFVCVCVVCVSLSLSLIHNMYLRKCFKIVEIPKSFVGSWKFIPGIFTVPENTCLLIQAIHVEEASVARQIFLT